MHEPFCFMRKIIGYDDDEWSHSSDDGSGYSNEGRFQNKKNINENKIIDYILGLFTKNEMSKDDMFLYGAGGFIAGWLAKTLANVLGM